MMSDLIAYFSLEDFTNHVGINIDHPVRVEGIKRTKGDMIQWVVVVTSKTYGDIALMSILVGEVWKFAVNDEPWHSDNADEAVWLVRKYLGEAGFSTAPGVWNPKDVIDNFVYGTAGLWHFEDHRLVANELMTDQGGSASSSSIG